MQYHLEKIFGLFHIIFCGNRYHLPVPEFENISEGFLVTLFAPGNPRPAHRIVNSSKEGLTGSISGKAPGNLYFTLDNFVEI